MDPLYKWADEERKRWWWKGREGEERRRGGDGELIRLSRESS